MLMPCIKLSATAFTLFLTVALVDSCGPGRIGARRRSPRKLTPLVYKQHVPNVAEHTLGASGIFESKLTRDHPKFKQLLVPNYNSDIIFRDEEGSGADRLMTQRCKEKLNTLAISVMNQWPGVRLRVTEAWDDEGLHAPKSLHYEGRAVDITTSDRDRSKYGMLARLAIESGFDFVYYESRSHIHCSVKRESADAARGGGCFHGDSSVHTPTGQRKMSELKVGDKVLAVDAKGTLQFSEILMFLDRDETQSRLYQTLETDFGTSITLTPSHLIYASPNNRTNDVFEGFVTFARDIEEGHYIYSVERNISASRSRFNTRLERVIRVTASKEQGVYAPLTAEGNIVVNNVVASCYALINQQTFAHFAFLPIRIADNFKQAFTHFAQKLQFSQQKKRKPKTLSKQQGIHWYPKLLYSAAHRLLPKRFLYH